MRAKRLFLFLVRFPPFQYLATLDKDEAVLLCVCFCPGFGEGIAGLIVQHLADRDGWRDTGHPGERDRDSVWPRRWSSRSSVHAGGAVARCAEVLGKVCAPAVERFFYLPGDLGDRERPVRSVMPVNVFLWLTQSENEEWFLRS